MIDGVRASKACTQPVEEAAEIIGGDYGLKLPVPVRFASVYSCKMLHLNFRESLARC